MARWSVAASSPAASRAACSSASRLACSSASRRARASASRRAFSSASWRALPPRRGTPSTPRQHLADRLGDQRAGADRVVVAGDHEVDPVRVAVGVDQADDRDAQALGLAHGDDLGFQVDHEHRVGHALHVLDAAEVGAQLRQVGLRGHPLARRQQRQLTLGLEAFEVVQAADALADGLEVGQQPQPAVVDVGHARRLGHVADGVVRLLLGADEQDGPAAVGERAGELLRLSQQGGRLEQVDDVDAAALTMDEAAHLGVPATRLVAEVNAGLQQLRDAYLSHGLLPLCVR